MAFVRRARFWLRSDGGLRLTVAMLYVLVLVGGITTLVNLKVFRDGVIAATHQRISGMAAALAGHLPDPFDAETERTRLAPLFAGLGEHSVVAVFDRDAGLLLSLPPSPAAASMTREALERLDVGADGQYVAPWPEDGVSRLWGNAQSVDGRSLTVVVGVPKSMVTNAVGQLAWHLAALMAALVCGAILLAYLLHHLRIRRRVEAELIETSRAAVAASEAKTAFLANMSHELRTPLTGVLGMADLLGRSRLDEEQTAMLCTIHTSAQTLLTLLNDVLEASRTETGDIHLQPVDLDLRRLAGDTVRLLAPSAEGKGLRLTLDVAEDCPRWVRVDPARLQQVLFSLIGNAIKFTDRGGVQLRLKAQDPHITFAIEDTGIGIDAATLSRLFTPFTQADGSSTRRHGGAGLGLAIARRLVGLMGGTLTGASTPGEGSRFVFTLPLPPASAPSAPAQPRATARRQLRVLLAEDNTVNQTLLEQLLKAMGHTVTLAENGAVALELAAQEDFDVVLMDIQMPVMDGETATKLIRLLPGARARLPVVALTADAMEGHRERYLAAGLNALLTKPITAEVLARTLDEMASTPLSAIQEDQLSDDDSPPASPETSDHGCLPVLDPAYLEDMRQWVGEATLVTLLATAPESFNEELAAIQAAWEEGDPQGVSENAHRLKGAAGSVGCRRLAETAQELQGIATAELADRTRLRELEAEVVSAIAATFQWRPADPAHP